MECDGRQAAQVQLRRAVRPLKRDRHAVPAERWKHSSRITEPSWSRPFRLHVDAVLGRNRRDHERMGENLHCSAQPPRKMRRGFLYIAEVIFPLATESAESLA